MSIINYWKQFETTGKVEDYLSYASNREVVSGTVTAGTDAEEGVKPYAGVCMGDGNCIKTDSCR